MNYLLFMAHRSMQDPRQRRYLLPDVGQSVFRISVHSIATYLLTFHGQSARSHNGIDNGIDNKVDAIERENVMVIYSIVPLLKRPFCPVFLFFFFF